HRPGERLTVQPAPAGQCDRQFHQGRPADPGQIADRPRQSTGRQIAPGDVGDRDDPHRHHAATAMTVPATTAAAPVRLYATEYPVVGAFAVLVGAFILTLNVRLTTTGLADIRGAL